MNKKQFKYWWLKAALSLAALLILVAACDVNNTASDQGDVVFDVHPTAEAVEADFAAICSEKADLDPAENSVVPGVLCTFSNKTGENFSVAEVVSNIPGVGVLGTITPTQMELPILGVTMIEVEDSFLRLDGDVTKVCVDFNTTGVTVAYACPFLTP